MPDLVEDTGNITPEWEPKPYNISLESQNLTWKVNANYELGNHQQFEV